MGYNSFASLRQFLPMLTNQSGGFMTPGLFKESGSAAQPVAKLFNQADTPAATLSTDEADNGGFDAMVYQSQMQRVSVAVQMQQIRYQASEGEDGASVNFQAQQLSFSFVAETRTEELRAFRGRTGAVADGLEGSQRDTFMQASQRVAARFSMSLEVTGAALSGYAGAAEGAAGEGEDAMGNFLDLANDALTQANEVMNQIFELLNGFFSGEGDFQTRLDSLLQGLSDIGLINLDSAQLPQAADAGELTNQSSGTQFQYASFSVQMEFEFVMEQQNVEQSDPITLDLDGDGVELTDYTQGAYFDITASMTAVHTAFVTGGDAFLAMDRNGNGSVDDGAELFGDQRGAANGFEELRKLDSNRDGVIDKNDKDFAKLLLFKDNGNGKTEEGELISLAEGGVKSIDLGYRNVDEKAAGGNRIAQASSFTRNDGSKGRAVDAILNYFA